MVEAERYQTPSAVELVVLAVAGSIGVLGEDWWPIVTASVVWTGFAALRRRRSARTPWFRRAAMFLSLAAFALGSEGYKLWKYAGHSPHTHDGFHHILDVGIGLSCVIAVVALAWGPLAHHSRWWMVGLLATLPAAALFTWAAVVGVGDDSEWGHMHVIRDGYVVAVPAFLFLTGVCAGIGRISQRGESRETRSVQTGPIAVRPTVEGGR